jgi:hypothetical protein
MMFIFYCSLAFLPAGVDGPQVDADRLQRQVIEYRKRLNSGHIVYHTKLFQKGKREPANDRKTEVWFEGKKIRNDIWGRFYYNVGIKDVVRRIHCHHCEKEGHLIDYPGLQEWQGKPMAMDLQPLSWYPSKQNPAYVTDPRMVGLAPLSLAMLSSLNLDRNNWLVRKDQYNRTIERGRWQEKKAYKISFNIPPDQKISIWVVPEYGPSVVRIECHDKMIYTQLECAYAQKFGFWYPVHYVYEYMRDNQSDQKEVADIEVLSLNEPIDPEIFQLKGMQIPVGTPVSTDQGILIWNGKELVPEEAPLRNVYRSGVGLRQWLLWGTSLVLALLAAFFVYRYFFRRSGQSASS